MQIDIDPLLNLPHVRVREFTFTDKEVSVVVARETKSEKCPLCQQPCSTIRSYTSRKVRDLDLLGRKTFLTVECRQFECSTCHRYFIEDVGFVEGNRGLTKRYEEYIYKMSTDCSIQQVSLKQDVCWATVNRIHEQYGQRQLKARGDGWRLVKVLSMDEISVRKGNGVARAT